MRHVNPAPFFIDSLTSRDRLTVLKHHRHRRALVQDPQLPLRALLICRICEDPTIQQRAVRVCHHAADVPRAVRLLLAGRVLQAVEVLLDGIFPVLGVALVDAVDGPAARHLHGRVRQDELAQRVVHREAVHAAAPHRDYQLRRCAVHRESRGHEFCAWEKHVFGPALRVGGQLEDAEDGANADAGVQVARAVDGIAHNGIPRPRGVEDDAVFFLFGDEQPAFARGAHGGNEEVVADNIEFLLVVACGVRAAGKASKVDERGASDVVGDGFEGELEGVAE